MSSTSKSYSQQEWGIFVSNFIEDILNGKHVFVQDLEPGASSRAYNMFTGKPFQGINQLRLASHGYTDPRWITFRQAKQLGGHVKMGERGHNFVWWKREQEVDVIDPATGKPKLDNNGNTIKQTVSLQVPRMEVGRIFNASQCAGLPSLESDVSFQSRFDDVRDIIIASGANVRESADCRSPCYLPKEDVIVMPLEESFVSREAYVVTLFHELGHWTGHESRLDRDLNHARGSAGYAREELVAEFCSFFANLDYGIGYTFSSHKNYLGHWVEALEKDPDILFQAAREGERALHYIVGLSRETRQEVSMSDEKFPSAKEPPVARSVNIDEEFSRIDLKVHYMQRDAFKEDCLKHGIQFSFDPEDKTWFVVTSRENVDKHLSRWKPGNEKPSVRPARTVDDGSWINPCSDALREAGLILPGTPILDGNWQRVPVIDAKAGSRDGAYIGSMDGCPAVYFENHRTGVKGTWAASERTSARMSRQEVERIKQRQNAERQAGAEEAAGRLCNIWKKLPDVGAGDHPYPQMKGVIMSKETDPSLRLNPKYGSLVIPLHNIDGDMVSAQWIGAEGNKGIFAGTMKKGSFHVVGTASTPDYCKEDPGRIIVCEGWSTAKSISAALDTPVVMAIDAGNLKPVAMAFRQKFPGVNVIIAADNDASKDVNRGLISAREAASAVRGRVVAPEFADGGSKGTDFNDLAQAEGPDAIRRQFTGTLQKKKETKTRLTIAR